MIADYPGIWGGLVSQNRSGTSSWYGFDLSGNTRILVSVGGVITDSYSYRAFGEETASSGSTVNPYRFGGQVGYYRDSSTREYLRQRHYRSDLSRFISQDPIGFAGGDVNLYRYVRNNPINAGDPSGLWETGSYFGDAWAFFKGEVSALNPLNWIRGGYGLGSYLNQSGWTNGEAWGNIGSSLWNGMQFWNQPDMNSAGQSFMGDVLLFTPALKKVPSAFAPTGALADAGLFLMSKNTPLQNLGNNLALKLGKSCSFRPTRPILIGETMNDVQWTAKWHGADTYRAWKPSAYTNRKYGIKSKSDWNDALNSPSAVHNDLWIHFQRGSGKTIYDIGLDPARTTRSPFYQLEDKALQGYSNRIEVPRFRSPK